MTPYPDPEKPAIYCLYSIRGRRGANAEPLGPWGQISCDGWLEASSQTFGKQSPCFDTLVTNFGFPYETFHRLIFEVHPFPTRGEWFVRTEESEAMDMKTDEKAKGGAGGGGNKNFSLLVLWEIFQGPWSTP